MTNNTRIAFYACLLLLAMIVGACVKDSTVPESIHKQPQDFRLADARKHYEENIGNLCFPEIYLKPIIQTKGSSYFHSLEQTPIWDRFHFSENGWSYIYEIPILYNITLKASMGQITQDGHLRKEDKEVKLQSNLIIQRYKESGNVHIFLSTVVGYISDPYAEIQGESPWLWTGDRQNFTGYQFFTNPDGSFKGAFQYRNSHRTSIILDIYDKNYEYVYPQEAFTISFGSIGTKGNEMEDNHKYCDDCQRIFDWDESNCPQCGAWLMDLDEIIVTPQPDPQPDRCSTCNFLIENCVCNNNNIDECPNCGLSHCSGECMNMGGDGTGSGGGISPGGNQEEGGENSSVKFMTYKGLYIDSMLLDNKMVRTLELLQQLDNDCMASALMSAISGTKFISSSTLKPDEVATFDPNTLNIKINPTIWQSELNIIEEMIHALQYKNGNYIGRKGEPNNLFNMEVEAKIALFIYLKKNNMTNMIPLGYEETWESLVSTYLKTDSIEDYNAIAVYVRTESEKSGLPYGDNTKFQEMNNYKNINNIRPLFNCNDYINYFK